MNQFVQEEKLHAVFPYLDNITICGHSKDDHDENLKRFFEAAQRRNLDLNESKSVLTTRKLPILGYEIRPDPERLQPLRKLPVPENTRSLNRCLGFFSYYSKWIPKFSDRLRPLTVNEGFPLNEAAVRAFQDLKQAIEDGVVVAVDESEPFEVETDASEVATAATLDQNGRPVAFFSRILQGSELKHPSIEKEAQAIIEAVRHWKHFTLRTDQKSVDIMFDQKHKGKIKNDKILRWRIELPCYSFDIVYKLGWDNIPPDALSRISCALPNDELLRQLHDALCHPGVTRLPHFIRICNLPYSIAHIKRVVSNCQICCECKNRNFIGLNQATLPKLRSRLKGPILILKVFLRGECNENYCLKLCVLCTHRAYWFRVTCKWLIFSVWVIFRIYCNTVNTSFLPFRSLP